MPSRLSITTQPGQQPLSASQKKFNSLIRKIEAERKLLADWEEAVPLYRQRRDKEFEPLLARYRRVNVELIQFLDQAAGTFKFSKVERETLHRFICDLAANLVDGEHQDAMKAIYNKYSETDYDAEKQEDQQALKSMLKEEFDLELDDDVDMDSPEDLLARLHQQMQARTAQAKEAQEAKERHRAAHKKTTGQRKQEKEAQQAGQSVRDIYRKLASALHPDRELDPVERARKTVLMQRVNQAYAGNKLLDMLQLQLEVEQIDPQAIMRLGEESLKRYNRVLADQLAELQQETLMTRRSMEMELQLDPRANLKPATLMAHLRAQMQQLTHDTQMLQRERQSLEDPRQLKRWLKEQRRQADLYDGLPDELIDLFR